MLDTIKHNHEPQIDLRKNDFQPMKQTEFVEVKNECEDELWAWEQINGIELQRMHLVQIASCGIMELFDEKSQQF